MPSLRPPPCRIRSLEQQGDEVTHEVYIRLNQTFITPLDPEDVQSLSSHLNDVLDGIEEAVHRMVSYRLTVIPSVVVELCWIVQLCAEELRKAFDALSTVPSFSSNQRKCTSSSSKRPMRSRP